MSEPGFFGGRVIPEDVTPDKPAPNLFGDLKGLMEGTHLPSKETLFPLTIWTSNHSSTIKPVSYITGRYFYVSPSIIQHYLWFHLGGKKLFLKSPFRKKIEGDLDWLIPYVMQYYGWTSEKEYQYVSSFLKLDDPQLHITLHKMFGFDEKQCKKLGLKFQKIDAKYEATPKVRGFFK